MKSLVESSLPTALVAPELIKVSAIPTKKLYDFTKRSQNAKYLEEGALDRIEYVEHSDSKLNQDDLTKIEIELKKKQKRRIKRERRGHDVNRSRRRSMDEEEGGEI